MKKLNIWILLLCLVLAACGDPGAAETSGEVPSRPASERPTEAPSEPGRPQGPPADTEVPVLETPEDGPPLVRGPAGTVEAASYLGPCSPDTVWADLDGDGETELLYWCYGPTSGLFTVGLCAYGLERGWPVLKAQTIYQLSWSDDLRFEQDETNVFFCLDATAWDPDRKEYNSQGVTRHAVSISEYQVLLDGDYGGSDFWLWGGDEWGFYGASMERLRERYGYRALLDHPSCFVWWNDISEGGYGKYIYAALSENGVSVTGLMSFTRTSSAEVSRLRQGVEPIQAVENPEALAGLTAEALTERFGPRHFEIENNAGLEILCWFTEDAKLLTVTIQGEVSSVSLWDMTAAITQYSQGT